jgi:hypothetical protein
MKKINALNQNSFQGKREGRYGMKFLMTVLIIRFVFKLVSNKKNIPDADDADVRTARILHPAEFALR